MAIQGRRLEWSSEADTLLGTMSDLDLANELDVSQNTVCRHRNGLGVPAFGAGANIVWTLEMDTQLGTVPDLELADKLGVSREATCRRRCKLGIPSWREQNRVLPKGVSAYDDEARHLYDAHRRHRKRELLDTLTYEQWLYACEWFDHKCAYCGREAFLTEDHLVPLSKGGPRTAPNILPACWKCNYSKRAKCAPLWIYEHFGMEEGKKIVERITKYLVEVLR